MIKKLFTHQLSVDLVRVLEYCLCSFELMPVDEEFVKAYANSLDENEDTEVEK